jgi:hypothetical protein
VYRIGVSSGRYRYRLGEHVKHHGVPDDKGRCGGVCLVCLAGTESPRLYRTAVSQRGKQEQQLIEECRAREPLSRRREKGIFVELKLKEKVFKIARGKGWHKVFKIKEGKVQARPMRNQKTMTAENTRPKKKK